MLKRWPGGPLRRRVRKKKIKNRNRVDRPRAGPVRRAPRAPNHGTFRASDHRSRGGVADVPAHSRLTAVYAHPDNPDAFLDHYRTKHAPIARDFPKLRSFGWTVCETADGSRPPHFVIAVLQWDSKDDALAALASPTGEAAIADLANFAGAGVDIELGEVQVEV